MHKYVMNMPNAERRLLQFKQEMQRIWWTDVETISAIDGNLHIKGNELAGCYPHHIGNYLTHIKILKDAIDKWYDDIIVMEDDLILCNFFISRYPRAMKQAPEDRELLRLSWMSRPDLPRIQTDTDEWLEDAGPRGTEMYRIRWSAIKKLYDFLIEHWPICPIDRVIHKAPIRWYMISYSLGMQWDNRI